MRTNTNNSRINYIVFALTGRYHRKHVCIINNKQRVWSFRHTGRRRNSAPIARRAFVIEGDLHAREPEIPGREVGRVKGGPGLQHPHPLERPSPDDAVRWHVNLAIVLEHNEALWIEPLAPSPMLHGCQKVIISDSMDRSGASDEQLSCSLDEYTSVPLPCPS